MGPAREEAKALVMGVLRDLRGVCIGTPNRRAYVLFFDWLYPDYLPMLVKAAELWWNDADVTVSVFCTHPGCCGGCSASDAAR
jgi:exportin-7